MVITNFVTITNLNLRNTFTGLILPSVTSVFYIYLLKENFEQVPDELYRAAKVDGTSDLKFLCQGHDSDLQAHHGDDCDFKGYRVLELLCVAPPHHRRSQPAISFPTESRRSRENGFGRENIPAMMAAVVVISLPLHRSVSGFPEPDHGRGIKRRDKGMKSRWKKYLAQACSQQVCFLLTGCHGAKEAEELRASGYL